MSRLDELIAELCPNGVEYKQISELAKISAGGIILLNSFHDYYYGYETIDGQTMPGYVDMMKN